MTTPVAVIDTNIVASGMITSSADSLQARLLDSMISGQFAFLLSPELLEEYREVLSRPKLRKYHRRNEEEIQALLELLRAQAIWIEPESSPHCAPDPNDQHLWDLVCHWEGAVLVTGDRALLEATSQEVPVLLPRDFLAS